MVICAYHSTQSQLKTLFCILLTCFLVVNSASDAGQIVKNKKKNLKSWQMLKDSHSGNMIPETTSVLEVQSRGVRFC